jgi:hypothetical protein
LIGWCTGNIMVVGTAHPDPGVFIHARGGLNAAAMQEKIHLRSPEVTRSALGRAAASGLSISDIAKMPGSMDGRDITRRF